MPTPHLSKSRYLAGLQCARRLWLDVHARETATPLSEATLNILRMGTEVGQAAHALFPGGVLVVAPEPDRVDEPLDPAFDLPPDPPPDPRSDEAFDPSSARPSDHAAAVRLTQSLIVDPSVPAIFEAAFEHANVRIRVDILERLEAATPETPARWGIREVKSSGSVKRAQHLPDLAIQKWVLEGCGLVVDSAELIHVNTRFVRGAGEIDWTAYFRRVELQGELAEVGTIAGGADALGPGIDLTARVDDQVEAMHRTLAEAAAPTREPGAFCRKPHLCGYWEACTASKSAVWKLEQTGNPPSGKPGGPGKNAARLARMIEATESGRPWLSEGLERALAVAAPPVWALDFETIGPAIPLFEGTRPFQQVPFQWSLHRLATPDPTAPSARATRAEHFEFLASGAGDPRPEVARSLVEVLGRDSAPILVYSPYEKTCLHRLAEDLPPLADALRAIAARLVDLLPIVRKHAYHPAQLGSFSIKKVGPAFASGSTYGDLEGVADGGSAMSAFRRIVHGELDAGEEARLRRELLAYCALDTGMLVELVSGLRTALQTRTASS